MDTRRTLARHLVLFVVTAATLAFHAGARAQSSPEPETPPSETPSGEEGTEAAPADAPVSEGARAAELEQDQVDPDTTPDASTPAADAEIPIVPATAPPPPAPASPTPATGDVRVHFEAGQGLQITSNDGRFELIVRARAQFLLSVRHPDAQDAGIDFELRRARIYFQGALFDPNIRFTLQLGVSPSCSDMGNNFAGNSCVGPQPNAPTTLSGFTPRWSPLLDWYVELRHLRELNVRVGQMIPTFSRTFTIGDANYQFIDRSLGDGEFNLDRTFAIELRSSDFLGLGWLRYYAGVMSTQGRDMPFAPDLHLGYYARVDVNPLGFFNDYTQGDLARNVDPRLSIGVGYAFLDHAPFDRGTIGLLPVDGGTTDQHLFTADFVFMWHGFSLLGEWSLRQAQRHQGTALDPMTMMPYATPTAPRTGYGLHATAGILLGDLPLEIVARVGMLRRMSSWDSSMSGVVSAINDQNEAGAGINWYIEGHPLKLSLWFTDVWRDDGTGSSGTQTVRLQFQATL
ncbi:MAG: hypothetical protein U0234_30775 [Sandaracinus sp.]